jgi:hypothetical protein
MILKGSFLLFPDMIFSSSKPDFLLFDNDMDNKYGATDMRKLKTADYFDEPYQGKPNMPGTGL